MTFDELVSSLPSGAAWQDLPFEGQAKGLVRDLTPYAGFVPPDLAVRADVPETSDPSIIIVSAAGAVGKSTLAREIACATGAPLWDLSFGEPVAGHAAFGVIGEAWPSSSPAVYAGLKNGTLFLVIDALDEARIKVAEPSFEAFVNGLAKLVGSQGGVRFVILGRTQIAETTWLLLEDLGVSTALYVIQPFTVDQAERYIEQRILAMDDPEPARTMRSFAAPFAQARDLIFEHLRAAIEGPAADASRGLAEEFIGYAPVLDAISVLLAGERNYADLTNRLTTELAEHKPSGQSQRTGLLRRIVERILEREHNAKLVSNLRPVLMSTAQSLGWSAWETLYGPNEQCGRLIGRLLGVAVQGAHPDLPGQLRGIYEEHLRAWFHEHPFLRDGQVAANVVFESYLFARALRDNIAGCRAAVESWLTGAEYKPSRLLADFYLDGAEEAGASEISLPHIGILYASLLSAETDVLRLRLALEGADPEDVEAESEGITEGEFELSYRSDEDPGERIFGARSFRTEIGPDDTIRFVRQLRDAMVVVPCTVSCDGGDRDFDIGPGVHVRCRHLHVGARALVVHGDDFGSGATASGSGVVLEALHYSGDVASRPIVRGDFRVCWPGASQYPWTDWFTPIGPPPENAPLALAYLRFRRIVMTLRSHSKGSLARLQDKIEHRRVLQGSLGERLLRQIVTDGILRLDGKFYHWVPDRAQELVGVSWGDLRGGRAGARLMEYLTAFVQVNPDLFT